MPDCGTIDFFSGWRLRLLTAAPYPFAAFIQAISPSGQEVELLGVRVSGMLHRFPIPTDLRSIVLLDPGNFIHCDGPGPTACRPVQMPVTTARGSNFRLVRIARDADPSLIMLEPDAALDVPRRLNSVFGDYWHILSIGAYGIRRNTGCRGSRAIAVDATDGRMLFDEEAERAGRVEHRRPYIVYADYIDHMASYSSASIVPAGVSYTITSTSST